MGQNPTIHRAVVMGAGALDVYLPQVPGISQLPPDYVPGGKVGWRPEDDAMLPALLADPGNEQHVGGNGLNTAAYLARLGLYEVAFAGVVGEHDSASSMIRRELGRLGITDHTVTVPGYLPSTGIIVRGQDDRMVRGRPRHPLDPHWSNEQIMATFATADLAIAASLKSTELTKRWLAHTPERAFRSLNPGSSEFDADPIGLTTALADRPVDLLALNDEELQKLTATTDEPIEKLALRASSRFATHVLCTLGKAGLLIAYNGQVSKVRGISVKKPVDTLGAGDRAHGVAADALARGVDPQVVAEAAAEGAAKVIQAIGAHGDLD